MNETKEPAPDSPALPIDTDPLASASDLLDAAELVRLVRDEFQRDLSVAAAKVSSVAARRPWLGRAAARLGNAVADLDARLASLPVDRPCPERYCCDVQLCVGYMHSGYPLMVPVSTAAELVDVKRLRAEGAWGFFHEMGHNHQNPDWTFEGTGEVTVNFFTLYVLDKLCGIPPRKSWTTRRKGRELITRWRKNGQTFEEWKREPFLALELFVRLQVAYGWGPFERMFREYRALRPHERPGSDDDKRDQWAIRFSRHANADIAAVFDAWKIPVSPAARRACAKYPRAHPDICSGVR